MTPKVSVIVPVYNVEEYIRDMLLSVQEQSFSGFEVIIVNDGSEDESQKIIDEFCRSDSRFKCFYQENAGVAAARNLGIENARGKYIVFYDPDDIVPKNALAQMVKTADKTDADMVIGVMQESNLGERVIYLDSQKLAKKKKIHPADPHFFRAWSLCNKMFSTSFIMDNNIRMRDIFHSEDGVFTFETLNYAENIAGCDTIAYRYVRRPFWMGASATQKITLEYLEELFRAHEIIISEANKIADKYIKEENKKLYISELYVRLIKNDILNVFYRNIWRAEEGVVEKLIEKEQIYRKHITDAQWENIKAFHRDLNLENGMMTASEMADSPLVSVIFSPEFTQEELEYTLAGLYNQSFPRFEIILSEKHRQNIDLTYSGMKNIKTFKEADSYEWEKIGLREVRGEYVIFMQEPLVFTKNTIKAMENVLNRKPDVEFVSTLIKKYDGNTFFDIPEINMAYGYGNIGKRKYNSLSIYDTFLANKLIRKKIAENLLNGSHDKELVKLLYSEKRFERIRKGPMLISAENWEQFKSHQATPSVLRMKFNNVKNSLISIAIEKIKRYITREDVEKIKSILKRKK